MRKNDIKALLEAIARRGPWGTTIVREDGSKHTFSKNWFIAQLEANTDEPTPRADKGTGYVYDAPKVRTRDENGKALTYSGRTRRLVPA